MRRARACPKTKMVVAGAAAALVLAQQLGAAQWDPDPAPGVQGGSGNWTNSDLTWTTDGGVTHIPWYPDTGALAAFSGTGGTVTIVTPSSPLFSGPHDVVVQDMVF